MLFFCQINGFHGNSKYTQDYVSLYPIYLWNIFIGRLQKGIFEKNYVTFLDICSFCEKQAILHSGFQYLTSKTMELNMGKLVQISLSLTRKGCGRVKI